MMNNIENLLFVKKKHREFFRFYPLVYTEETSICQAHILFPLHFFYKHSLYILDFLLPVPLPSTTTLPATLQSYSSSSNPSFSTLNLPDNVPYFANRLLQASNPILSIPSSNLIGPRVTFPQPNFTSNKLGFRLSGNLLLLSFLQLFFFLFSVHLVALFIFFRFSFFSLFVFLSIFCYTVFNYGFQRCRFQLQATSMDMQSDWFNNFDPFKPISDRPKVKGFHHVEFWCSDATTTACHFSFALGMPIVAKSDLSTGNTTHASYLLRSGDVSLLFTAPYSPLAPKNSLTATIPTFLSHHCFDFVGFHGLAGRASPLKSKML